LQEIRSILKKYDFHGNLIDLGCGEKPYKDFFDGIDKYIGIDFSSYSSNKDFKGCAPDLFFNEIYTENFELPFANDSYDNAVAFQVIEHHKDPQKMLSEMIRVVKNGGYILLTVPFLGGVHEEPNDYQRFTEYGMAELLEKNGCAILESRKAGKFFSVVCMLAIEYLNAFAAKSKFNYYLSAIILPLLLLAEYGCLILDKVFTCDKFYIASIILAQKNDNE